MPVKLRIYLDTSVISAHVDSRDRGRQELTQLFWSALPAFDASTCPITLDELRSTPDQDIRDELLKLAGRLSVFSWTDEMERLAVAYVGAGVFSPAMIQDARHVAACTVSRIPVLISWNFRHLVNRTRRIRVNLLNSREGYGQVEIIAPPELV
jgi:predicted nucleic acid-binding protein